MKIKITITAALFLQLIFLSGTAQNNELKFILVEGPNGKPLGKINAITQDKHGYMWFLGQDEKCLYRYDGNRMISFRHDEANPNSLGTNDLETIYADNSGMIWIGGVGLLDQFNPATGIFKHYRHIRNDSSSLSDSIDVVSIILRDHLGTVWVGTHNGLDRLDEKTGKFTHYRNEPGNPRSLSSNGIRAIYEDHSGVLWIGTGLYWENNNEGGLNRLDRSTGTFTRYLNDPKNPHTLINNKVRAIFEDSRGIFWVGTAGDGLHTMDRSTGSFERHLYNPAKPDGLSRPELKRSRDGLSDHITFINEDSTGAIWIGTYVAGINRYDPVTQKITHYQSSNGFPDSTCWNGFISHDGVLWISTEDSKLLYRVDPFHKSIYSVPTVNQALSFLEDREGYLWVGTLGGGLLKFDQHKNLMQQFNRDPSDPIILWDNVVACIVQIPGDTILVGTGNGVRIFNKATQQFSRFRDGNLNDSTYVVCSKIFQDKQGLIWFGRWGLGLVRYNPKDNSFKHFLSDAKDSSSIGSNYVNSILEDRSGVFWVAGKGGINRLNRQTGRFNHYLAGSYIGYLYEDSGGALWAGTDNGLFLYNRKEDKFASFFDPQSEISSSTVGGIIEDNAKNLWLTSPSAIIRLNPSTKETFIYGSRFGISPNSLFEWGATYKDQKGRLFIGNPHGFYIFSPEELARKTDLKIIITDLLINTFPVLPGKGSLLQKPVEEINDLELKYNQNNIAFNFAAIDYRAPETVKYFYMLEGYDREWQEVKEKKENSSYYFNLPVGTYVYRVKAFNSDGTKAEKSITIHINPPWWRTWWFRTFAILLLAATFYLLIRWWLHRKFRLQLERTERGKQIAELEMQALRSQMNPHFIFNSLNSINMFILENNKLQASEYLSKFSKLIRLILQNSQEAFIPLERELEALQLYLELESLRFEQRFEYKINVAGNVDASMLKVPPLIIQPYAENAIWHGLMQKKEKGHLEIEAYEKDEILFCRITDDGIGRKKAAELKSKSASKQKSMGMRITADRIAMLQQQGKTSITITDLVLADGSPGGTEVLIAIPVVYD